jgi:hypothetical protein
MPDTETKVQQKDTKEKEKPVQEMSLPTLLGLLTQRLLTAHEGTDAGAKQAEEPNLRRDLRLWYEAQPIEDRKAFASKARKTAERYKLLGEVVSQELLTLSMQDL